jgi:hypothetical protein
VHLGGIDPVELVGTTHVLTRDHDGAGVTKMTVPVSLNLIKAEDASRVQDPATAGVVQE